MNVNWLLNDKVTVKRPSSVKDGYGGTAVSYVDVPGPNEDGTWPARVSPRLPRLSFTVPVDNDEQTQRAMRVCYFMPDADVQRNDVIYHGLDRYLVISTVIPSNPAVYLRADAVFTQAGN